MLQRFNTIVTIFLLVLCIMPASSFNNPTMVKSHSFLPTFPRGFLWGVGTSSHQAEGNCTNNTWSLWEKEKGLELSGKASEHWEHYKDDVQLIKNLGVDAYRFSIEWSKVMPRAGEFDELALQHYVDLCNELNAQGIRPCITLHHYADPIWFAQLGGFEKEENIHYFVEYAAKVFKKLHGKVALWFTFNAPEGYCYKGYFLGNAPPAKKDMNLMVHTLKNVLEAHVQAYHALKALYPHEQIGIIKNIYQHDPYYKLSPIDRIGCWIRSSLLDTGFFSFFSTGTYYVYIPFKAHCKFTNEKALGALDFVGINYYSHTYVHNFTPQSSALEEKTDNPTYTIYPEGMARAIKEVSDKLARPLGKPMYITENGIATTDDHKRSSFIQSYLEIIAQACRDGYDVRGYFHWALLDLYEWGTYNKRYGLYAVDFNTLERTLRPGAQRYIDIIKHAKEEHTLIDSGSFRQAKV